MSWKGEDHKDILTGDQRQGSIFRGVKKLRFTPFGMLVAAVVFSSILVGCSPEGPEGSFPVANPAAGESSDPAIGSPKVDTVTNHLPGTSQDVTVPNGFREISRASTKVNGTEATAVLAVSEREAIVYVSTGHQVTLPNPTGNRADGSLRALPVDGTDHLLAKVYDGRIITAWVLIPTDNELSVAFTTQADDDVTVYQGLVKVGNRRYRPEGGYIVVTELYRFDETSNSYVLTQ